MHQNWFKRRWLDFRLGHSTYLIFAMGFANFIVIQYRLLIEYIPVFQDAFSTMWVFALIFIVSYIPVAMIIGHWHRKTQLKIEQAIYSEQNPYTHMIFEEFRKIREELHEISKKVDEIEKTKTKIKNVEG